MKHNVNTGSNYRCTLNNDSEFSIKAPMNDWHLVSHNVCIKINVLLDLINVRNISYDYVMLLFALDLGSRIEIAEFPDGVHLFAPYV